MEIAKKKYEADVSAEEKALIQARVQYIGDGTVFFYELPIQTEFTVNTTFDVMEKLLKEHEASCLLIDLTEAGRPDARARKCINERFARLEGLVKHTAYYTGKNGLINTVIKFVMYGTGQKSYSVQKTKEEALRSIANAE